MCVAGDLANHDRAAAGGGRRPRKCDSRGVPPTAPDLEIIAALRRGDAGANDRFLKAYADRIFSFGMMVCGHREDAEDIAQESMVAALKAIPQLRAPKAFHVWLYRIVKNACYRQRSLYLRDPPPAPLSLDDLAAAGAEVEATAAWPDVTLLREEARQQVQQAVAALPAEDRLIVLLRDFEDLSTAEVARVMELGESAVKMRLHRARRKLRQTLDPYFAPAPAPTAPPS